VLFKEAIKPTDQASEAILALKPVTFPYKRGLDPEGIPHFGLVAEEVEKVPPDLVARDGDGKATTVRYGAVNAMLLNEFLKEHCKVEELKGAFARQHPGGSSRPAPSPIPTPDCRPHSRRDGGSPLRETGVDLAFLARTYRIHF
jgi:Chaperone of endosialidase